MFTRGKSVYIRKNKELLLGAELYLPKILYDEVLNPCPSECD